VSRKIWQPWYNGASFVCAFFPITTTTVTLKFWRGMKGFSIFWRKFLARNERILIFLAKMFGAEWKNFQFFEKFFGAKMKNFQFFGENVWREMERFSIFWRKFRSLKK
jgi:hypothetical protein